MILAHYFIAQTKHLYGLGLGFSLAKFFAKRGCLLIVVLKNIVFYFLNQILNQIIMIVFA